MSSTNTTISRLVAKAGQLYSLPAAAMEVLALTRDPEVDARALKECIENDPALTTKLLRVVNSSLFGLSRQVSDLSQALALLGTKPLKLLVLGFSLPAGLFHGVSADVLGWYWRHTLTRAVAAREICERLWNQSGDEAFIAGLLQDLGILLLIQELGDPYVQFLQKVLDLGRDLPAEEARSLGFVHTTLSAQLLDRWGLPKPLVEAARLHATADDANQTARSLNGTLHLAEMIAQFLADKRTEVLAVILDVSESQYGLTRESVREVIARLQGTVAHLAEVLSLQLPDGLDHEDLVCQAQTQLAGVAEDVTGELLAKSDGFDKLVNESQNLVDEFRRVSQAAGQDEMRSRDAVAQASGQGARAGAAAKLTTAVVVEGPRPTGLDDESARAGTEEDLVRKLGKAAATCRQSRCPLSLLLVQLEEENDPFYDGPNDFAESLKHLESLCRSLDHPLIVRDRFKAAGFSLILPDCDRRQAVQMGNDLIEGIRGGAHTTSTLNSPGANLSVGVATVSMLPKNFPPSDLLGRAKRCLYGSHASGGVVVKSIEI